MRNIPSKDDLKDSVFDFEFNNRWAEQKNAILDTNQDLVASSEIQQATSQTIKAMVGMSFTDIGTPNLIKLVPLGISLLGGSNTFRMPDDWLPGMRFKFIANTANTTTTFIQYQKNDNTFVSTVELKSSLGNSLLPGDILLGKQYEIFYNGTNCILTPWSEDVVISRQQANAIMNGKMALAQRYELPHLALDQENTIDRWLYRSNDPLTEIVIDRSLDVPVDAGVLHSMSIHVDVASAGVAVDNFFHIGQYIEGYNYNQFVGRDAVLSFNIKSSVPGDYAISFRNMHSGTVAENRSYVVVFPVTTEWSKISIPLRFDYSGGVWDFTSGIGLRICLCLGVGLDFGTTTHDSWLPEDKLGDNALPVQFVENVTATLNLTKVQFSEGLIDTDFEYRTIQQELELCGRYYEKNYNVDDWEASAPVGLPGFATWYQDHIKKEGGGNYISTVHQDFKITKRSSPLINLYNALGGTASYTDINVGERGFNISYGSDDLIRDNSFYFAADAELRD